MKIWQIAIGTEEGGDNLMNFSGVASTAKKAIIMAEQLAKNAGFIEGVYCSRVFDLGDVEFEEE